MTANQALLIRIAPLLFVSLWSTGFIAAKYSMHNADPFVFLCLRFSITAVMLVPIILLAGRSLPRDIWSYRHDMVTEAPRLCQWQGVLESSNVTKEFHKLDKDGIIGNISNAQSCNETRPAYCVRAASNIREFKFKSVWDTKWSIRR